MHQATTVDIRSVTNTIYGVSPPTASPGSRPTLTPWRATPRRSPARPAPGPNEIGSRSGAGLKDTHRKHTFFPQTCPPANSCNTTATAITCGHGTRKPHILGFAQILTLTSPYRQQVEQVPGQCAGNRAHASPDSSVGLPRQTLPEGARARPNEAKKRVLKRAGPDMTGSHMTLHLVLARMLDGPGRPKGRP